MRKIASPQDLQTELQSILALCQGEERPSRERLAAELNALADRVAGTPLGDAAKILKGKDIKSLSSSDEKKVFKELDKMSEDELKKLIKVYGRNPTLGGQPKEVGNFLHDVAKDVLDKKVHKSAAVGKTAMTLDQGEKLMWNLTQDAKKMIDRVQSLRGSVLREKKQPSEETGFWDEMDKALKKAEGPAHGVHRALRDYS